MESWVQSWRPRTNAFCDFPLHLCSAAPARQKWCQVRRSAAPVTHNHLSKPEDLMLQNATPLRKLAPWPPNISDEHVSCTAPATRNSSFQILFKCPTLPSLLEMLQNPHVLLTFRTLQNSLRKTTSELSKAVRKRSQHVVLLTFWLRNVLRATTACTFSTSQLPNVVRVWCALYILTWKCASHPNGVHFFDISTSKSGPGVVCFVHFDLETCFAPQRRALFWHLNFQKCSGRSGRDFFGNFFTCKCASRHNGVQLFISHLARWLRTRRFKRAYFSTLRSHKSLEKTQCFVTLLPFRAPGHSFFWLSLLWSSFFFSLLFSSLTLPIFAFHLSIILSEVWLLNFLR